MADESVAKLCEGMPKDTYNELRMTLPSGRVLVVIVPDGIDHADTTAAIENLEELRDLMRGWLPN